MKKVVVVGAGLGGLSVAARLAHAGFSVTVLEKNESVGGKMGTWQEGGYTFDTGPSLLTMPFVVKDLFAALGKQAEDYMRLDPIEPSSRCFFSDGSRLDTWTDTRRMTSEIEAVSPGESDGFHRFLKHGEDIYAAAAQPFLFREFGPLSVLGLIRAMRYLPAVLKLDAFRSLHAAVSGYVRDSRLQQLLNRYATYNGSSPYLAPATLAIIPFVEFSYGAWYLRGGMYTLARSLKDVAEDMGVDIRTSAEVARINTHRTRAVGVTLHDGEEIQCDVVVCNADALHAGAFLLDGRGTDRAAHKNGVEPSLGVFLLLLGVRQVFPHLLQHNVFFSYDYRKEFEELVTKKVPAGDPTIYVNLTCKTDPEHAPAGCSNMFVLVNAPPLSENYDWEHMKHQYRDLVLDRLEARGLGNLRKSIEVEHVMTPLDFQNRFHAFRGSIYGTSSNTRRASFLRPPNRSRKFRNLFFVGGSTHPGGGIPLVLLSGKIVAEMVTSR